MPCLCLHGDRPPECVHLYKLTEVQLANLAIDFHTISVSQKHGISWPSPLLQTY